MRTTLRLRRWFISSVLLPIFLVTFTAPPPADFQAALDALRKEVGAGTGGPP